VSRTGQRSPLALRVHRAKRVAVPVQANRLAPGVQIGFGSDSGVGLLIPGGQRPDPTRSSSTSKGPYFLASDLPPETDQRDQVLLAAMGSGHWLEIDGIGGGNPLTSKAAIVSPSNQARADVNYLFAQAQVEQRVVDTSPNCGNMLPGIGPFAIEAGLVPAQPATTTVRIYNVNTKRIIEARIATPNGTVHG
jgi:2-methylaconitate cis-trans-isomerase PrpF